MTNNGPDRTLPPDDAGQIEALRDEFERAYQAGEGSRIEVYLERVGEALQPAAFRELLKTDVAQRRSRQEAVDAEDYRLRFPQYESAIREACRDIDADRTILLVGGKPPSGLHVRCPHCHNPIELVPDAELENVQCDSCGSTFSLTSDPGDAARDADGFAQFGHFKLVERLGMGAFGTVWKAHDTELDRTVAIKIPRSGQLDKQQQEFFLREARAAAQLRHPNIVPVYEVGREGDTLYIVSEFVSGVTLADRLAAGPLSAQESAELCAKIAEALHHAHEQGVIHRDLKPANVMLDDAGEPHVMDFGLARREAREITMTVEGKILGTPAYMPPEQARGDSHAADRRSDVYSLGVILFELLTGELPFRGNIRMLIQQVLHDEPPSPRKLNANIPKDLETIALKCLEKDPQRRFASALDLAVECRRFLAREPIQSRPISRVERGWRWCRRNPMAATVAALGTFVAIAGPFVAVHEAALRERAENEREIAEFERERAENETAKALFAQGNAEYAAGSVQSGCEKVFRAWTLCSESNSLKPGYKRVLVDRLTRGERSYASLHHEDAVRSVAFSRDGKRVLTGSIDQTARLWDAATGQPLGEPMRHEALTIGVLSVAFGPHGKRVLTGSLDGSARLWDAATGEPVGAPMHHRGEVRSVAFSPDGLYVLTGSSDGTARLWNSATGKPVGEPMETQDTIEAVAFSPDSLHVLTGSTYGARLWDTATGQPFGAPMQHLLIAAVAFSPDSKRLLTASQEGTARLWDAATGQPLGEPMHHEDVVWSVAFSPDGKRALTGSRDKTARLWDAATGQPLGEPMHHEDAVRSVAFSPDGKHILTGSDDKTARLWDAATGQALGEPMRHGGGVRSVAFSPDGQRILTGSEERAARLWHNATGQPPSEPMRHEGLVLSVTFSPDGKRVLTGSIDKTARLWDAATGQPFGEPMRHDGGVRYVAFSPDGQRVLTGSDDKTARLWDAATGQPFGEPMRHEGLVLSAAFSPDGKRVITGTDDQKARLWDAATGQPLGEPMSFISGVLCVAFSPDGPRVITAATDQTARLWDAGQHREMWMGQLGEPMRHEGLVMSAALSPDGKRVITGSDDKAARLWDAATGQPLGELLRHEGWVVSVAFCPDSQRVITGAADGTARLWDAATGAPMGEPMRHEDQVISVAFSPDSKQVVTGSADKTARLWDAWCIPAPRESRAWFEVLLGRKLGDTNQFLGLSAEEIGDRWKLLENDQDWTVKMREFQNRRASLVPLEQSNAKE